MHIFVLYAMDAVITTIVVRKRQGRHGGLLVKKKFYVKHSQSCAIVLA